MVMWYDKLFIVSMIVTALGFSGVVVSFAGLFGMVGTVAR